MSAAGKAKDSSKREGSKGRDGSSSKDGNDRSLSLYPQLMRASLHGDANAVGELILQGKEAGKLDDNLLRIGLQNAAKRGHGDVARVLLEHGARTDLSGSKGSPALHWCVISPQKKGHLDVARLLLDGQYAGCPADMEWRDESGRTIFMSAAWRNHKDMLKLLLDRGAQVNARDDYRRSVLHNLAVDKKCRWDPSTIALILEKPIDLDIRDDRGRTCLHWAAGTGKTLMVETLLTRSKFTRPDLSLTTPRGKTALHLACSADPAVPTIVEMLLKYGADPSARSDGGFTALHNSVKSQDSVDIIRMLLKKCPSLIHAKTSTGMTPLHFAAEGGSKEVVRFLLSYEDEMCKVNAKDTFYSTPLIRAAQYGHLDVVEQLAPHNNTNRMSEYSVVAANHFEATIVDFRYSGDHQNIVQKRTVFETLYGKDKNGDHSITTIASKIKARTKAAPAKFRWLHLPSNNIAWVEDLITKAFIEDGASDIEGFKAVEKALSNQHRGPTYHSHFMRPLCQRCPRYSASESLQTYSALESALRASASRIDGLPDIASSPERPARRRFRERTIRESTQEPPSIAESSIPTSPVVDSTSLSQGNGPTNSLAEVTESSTANDDPITDPKPGDPFKTPPLERIDTFDSPGRGKGRGGRSRQKPGSGRPSGTRTASDPKRTARQNSFPLSDISVKSGASNTARSTNPGSNIVFFMPYLHFETDARRKRMRQAVKNAEAYRLGNAVGKPSSNDEALVWAHLHSTTGLHLRRTLDQFFLHGVEDTELRDTDQVVGRYCRSKGKEERIIMVDQLWMWILGPGLIVTSFAQRWDQPKNDVLSVLDGIIEDFNAKTRAPVQSVYDLALLITNRVSGAFDRHRPGDEDYQFLDMFESSIGNVNSQETALYREFYEASEAVHAWLSRPREEMLRDHPRALGAHAYPDVVDRFLDIGKETALLSEIKDIRDELNMISMVLTQQKSVLPALSDAICDDLTGTHNNAKARETKRKVDEQKKMVDVNLNELTRMGRQAESIESSLLSLLDLKQKQSNAFEARFARDQAAGTVKQGQIVMIFTMTTILFLPISFMAAFFAINIREFPRDGNGNLQLPLSYVLKYMLPIGLGMSLLLIAIAFSVNPITAVGQATKKKWSERRYKTTREEAKSHFSYESKKDDIYKLGRYSKEIRASTDSSSMVDMGRGLGRAETGMSELSYRRRGINRDLERG